MSLHYTTPEGRTGLTKSLRVLWIVHRRGLFRAPTVAGMEKSSQVPVGCDVRSGEGNLERDVGDWCLLGEDGS